MLTAIAMACLFGQYQPPCAGPGCVGNAGFPVATCNQCGAGGRTPHGFHHHKKIDYNFFKHDENWNPLFSKNVCPLGAFVPCGDPWAAQMHEGMANRAAASMPASGPPSNPPASSPSSSNPPESSNPPNPPAPSPPPADSPDVPAVPLP